MGGTGEALWRAILEQPLDDHLRWMYADWWDENIQSERAELIRLQCAREQLDSWDPQAIEIDERLTRFGLRLPEDNFPIPKIEQMLLTDLADESAHASLAQAWLRSSSGDITNPCGIPRIRRGFAEYFRLDDEDCTDRLEQLPSLTPVTALRLRGRVGASADTIRRLPEYLRRLEVAPWWPSGADFSGLCKVALPSSLTELSLEPPYEWDDSRFHSLMTELGPILERSWDSLYLGFRLGDRTRDQLACGAGRFRELVLDHVLGDGYDRLFRGNWAAHVERVRLRMFEEDHQMTAAGLRRLMTALGGLPRLRLLDLRRFAVTSRSWSAFIQAGGLTRTEQVILSQNEQLGSAWLRHLAGSGKPTALRKLVLWDCGFSDNHMRWLIRGSHPHLVWLDLAHVHSPGAGLTGGGIKALLRSPLRHQLRCLQLTNHSLGDDGLRLLAAHEWPELRLLDVRWDTTQDAVADLLFRSHVPNMIRLEVGCRGAADRLARALGEAVPSERPFTLYLNAQFTDDHIAALLRSRYLRHLRRFWLGYPQFSEAGKRRLRDEFGERLTLY